MTDTSPAPIREVGLLSRAVGVIVAPAATFRAVVASPRPAGILFLVCLVIGLSAGVPQFTERGRQAAMDLQMSVFQQRSSQPVPPEMRQGFERMAPYMGYLTLGSTFLFVPATTVVIAGLYWLIFNVLLGGTADFKQVLGVVTHASVIGALGALVAAPIQYMQGVMTTAGPFHLGALAPMLEPTNLGARLLQSLTVFGLWQAVVTGVGFAVLYRRPSTSFVVTLLFIYVGFTAVFWVGLPALF